MKIDLHVHSKFSSRPSQWILRKMNCPESFVEPATIYRTCRAQGMDMVTITDHNVIDGSLSIAHLPHTFISEEITAHFPEDGCKVHVLAWNIDEQVHDEIQALRRNIYELTDYLRRMDVAHALAHPLFAVNDKLTLNHFEKLLLLFDVFESNGTRDSVQNNSLRRILNMLTQAVIDDLANKHDMEPKSETPWRKSMTGGSDDHSGLHIARMHTEVTGARNLDAFLEGVARGDSEPRGRHASPKAFGHILYGIAYQFYRERYGLSRYVNTDSFCTFLDRSLSPDSPKPTCLDKIKAAIHNTGVLRCLRSRKEPEELRSILKTMAQQEFESRRSADPDSMRKAADESEWFDFANATANRVLAHYGDRLMERVVNADFFNIYKELASAGVLYTLLSPFFVGFSVFTKDRAFCKQALSRFLDFHPGLQRPRKRVKIAHFTDTFFETNGVAKTLQEHVDLARASNKEYAIVTCDDGSSRDLPGVLNFKPVGRYELPEYPELSLFYPPFLQMLTAIYDQGFTHIHSATPGPIGLAALGIARALKLPISGTYHTALPQYALHLTGDEAMEEFMWKAMVWYYNQMDYVYVPSDAVGQELRSKGMNPDKIRLYPRGVDVDRFTPQKRNGFFKQFSLNGSRKLLYVGRISREKNLHILEQAYMELCSQYAGKLDFVVVGDGPYRQEMEANLDGTGAVFTGKLEGDDLAAAYASSDLFVFPSTTDTFGRVVLEAQASGLPVVVTNQGGPQENLLPGQTGVVVEGGNSAALKDAILSLIGDGPRLQAMGKSAREYMETRSLSRCFDQTWSMYAGN